MSKSVRSAREEQQALEALHRLDEECVHYQRANDYLRAFDCMERALVLRRHFFGLESEEVALACRALAEMCNLLAMSFLQQDNFPVAVDLLKKAEVLTAQHGNRFAAEHATTLNNLACYYRRLGKLHAAMTSLRSAVAIERRLGRVGNAADTLLNLCAVLSQLGKHDQALAHAQEALLALQEDVFQPSAGSPSLDRVSVMCIAYHNIGVEQEFLKAYDECVQSYKKGVGLAEQYLGPEHSVTTTIRNSYLAAKRSLSAKPRGIRQQRSDDPYASSPSKAARRLLSSPRDNSGGSASPSSLLRLPSPLAKEKQRQNIAQIPTPRSIVADALSRRALPPLDSPNGRDPVKKSGGKAAVATPLTPTDPFFSPRYRFPDNEARVETEPTASASPDKTKRVSSASRRRSSSKKERGAHGGHRVSFAEVEQGSKLEETNAEIERERDLVSAGGQDSPSMQEDVAAVTPTDEVIDAIANVAGESETTKVDVEASRDASAIQEDVVETVESTEPKLTRLSSQIAETEEEVVGGTSTIQEEVEKIVESVDQSEATNVSPQIAEIEEEEDTLLAAEIENSVAPADVLRDDAKEDLEAPQPPELEVETAADTRGGEADRGSGDSILHQSDALAQLDQGGFDVTAEEADDVTSPDAVIETIAPVHEEVENKSTEINFLNGDNNGDVVNVEAGGEADTEIGTIDTSAIDLVAQGDDSEALMVETAESETLPVMEDLGAVDQDEEAAENVPVLSEPTGDEDGGENHEATSDEHTDVLTEEQTADEWSAPHDEVLSAETTRDDVHPEYHDEVARYDGAEDASQLHTNSVVDSDEAYHYEYSDEQHIEETDAVQPCNEDYGGDDAGLEYAGPHPIEEHQDLKADHQMTYDDAPPLEESIYESGSLEETRGGAEQTTDDANVSTTLDLVDQEHQEGDDQGGEASLPSTE